MNPRECYKVVPYGDGWAIDHSLVLPFDGPLYMTVFNVGWEPCPSVAESEAHRADPDWPPVAVFPSEDAAWAWAEGGE